MESLILNNWRQFLDLVDLLDTGDATYIPYAYRGQSDASWGLEPSLLRLFKNKGLSNKVALEIESRALSEFKSQAHLHLSANELSVTPDTISWWTVMQHHGAPTRLLDWSSSVYVAAYFAVTDNLEKDGAIWLAHQPSAKSLVEGKFRASSMPKNEAEIQTEYLSENTSGKLLFCARNRKSSRMAVQQGMFSISPNILGDHGEILDEIFSERTDHVLYKKLIIPAHQKAIFLSKLRAMTVSANSLYPGIDGLGKSVKEFVMVAGRKNAL